MSTEVTTNEITRERPAAGTAFRDCRQNFIAGAWVDPLSAATMPIINPDNGQSVGTLALSGVDDVNRAVAAAHGAFDSFSQTPLKARIDLLQAVLTEYARREAEMAEAITLEMGAPAWLASQAQAAAGAGHLVTLIALLNDYPFEERTAGSLIVREPVGVCALITPWNWPSNQIATKVGPALAAGCTMILKPSELAPYSSTLWAEILETAGVPAGVFNLVHGDGPTAGAALSGHPDVDMVSFTGSTRAGVNVAELAAPTVKRVHQELGGKSANILLDDADFAEAVPAGIRSLMLNSGQSCNAPSRMLVPAQRVEEVKRLAGEAAAAISVGRPATDPFIGPVISENQFNKIQSLISRGIEEGATVVAGGTGKPDGLDDGYYVRPTVFADVNNQMTIAREEIFGPVLAIIGYTDEEEAIRIANDTEYGLYAYVQSGDAARAARVARRLRVGAVNVNNSATDLTAPFGGYRRSGNGREWGAHGLEAFLEIKAVVDGGI